MNFTAADPPYFEMFSGATEGDGLLSSESIYTALASSSSFSSSSGWETYANFTGEPWSYLQEEANHTLLLLGNFSADNWTLQGLTVAPTTDMILGYPGGAGTPGGGGGGTSLRGAGGGGGGRGRSYSDKPWNLLRQSLPMVVILSFAYVVVFVLAIVNNSLVVAVICRNPQLKTVTNYFIANLAVADILVSLIVLPITLQSNLFEEWWLGPVLCKAAPYLQGVVVSSSVNTLAAVAVERYLAIFYPRTNRMTPRIALVIITFLWLVPMCIFVPWVIVYQQKELQIRGFTYVTCMPVWRSPAMQRGYTLGAVFLTCYLIPLIFIAIFYLLIGVRVWKRKVAGMRGTRVERNIQRSKIRIVRMLLVVFVVFAMLWLPLYSFRVRVLFGPEMKSIEKVIMRRYLVPLAQWLGAANSCVNPFIYCYFSANFRKSIIAVIRSRSCCSKISL